MEKSNFLELTLSLSLSFGLILGLIFVTKQIKNQKEKLEALEKEILISERNLESFKIFSARENEIGLLDKIVIEKNFPIPFVSFLENEAKKNGLEIEISINQTKEFHFGIRILGQLNKLMHYLEKIENSEFPTQFKNLSLKKTKEGLIEAQVSVKVFAK